jgi:hypothetical protein
MKKILLLLIISLFNLGCKKEKEVKATILSHVVTSDRLGDPTYRTIVKTDDGYIQELTGLNYYSIPAGNSVTITVYR